MKTLIIIMICTFLVQIVWLFIGELTRSVPEDENFISNPCKWVFGKKSWQNVFRFGFVILFIAACVEIWLLFSGFLPAIGTNLFILALISLVGSLFELAVAWFAACVLCALAVLVVIVSELK